jgi:hypothetical protein
MYAEGFIPLLYDRINKYKDMRLINLEIMYNRLHKSAHLPTNYDTNIQRQFKRTYKVATDILLATEVANKAL